MTRRCGSVSTGLRGTWPSLEAGKAGSEVGALGDAAEQLAGTHGVDGNKLYELELERRRLKIEIM